MIRELLAEGKSREEVVKIVMMEHNVPEIEARFRIALVLGETKGDVIEIGKAAPAVRQTSRSTQAARA